MSWIYNQLHWHSVRCAIIVTIVVLTPVWAFTQNGGML